MTLPSKAAVELAKKLSRMGASSGFPGRVLRTGCASDRRGGEGVGGGAKCQATPAEIQHGADALCGVESEMLLVLAQRL